jgi:hypothetical protein
MSFDPFNLDDPGWAGLVGGYRVRYDPRPALHALETGDRQTAWEELWTELYHQGDVGEASYAAVPQLVRIEDARTEADWNTYALVAVIDVARRDPRNPVLPDWLKPAYQSAWRTLARLGMARLEMAGEATLVSSIIGVLAIEKGQYTLGRLGVEFTEDERREMLGRYDWRN